MSPVDPYPLRKLPEFVLEISFQNQTKKLYAYQGEFPPLAVTEQFRNDTVPEKEYNSHGAMLFAVAVILIYGVSIALLIGTTLRPQDDTDYEVKGFLRSYARLDEKKRSSEKLKTRKFLIERNLLPMLPGISFAATPNILHSDRGNMAAASRAQSLYSLAPLKEEDGSSSNRTVSALLSDSQPTCDTLLEVQGACGGTPPIVCDSPLVLETDYQPIESCDQSDVISEEIFPE